MIENRRPECRPGRDGQESVGNGPNDADPFWRDYPGSLNSKDLEKLVLSGILITILGLL